MLLLPLKETGWAKEKKEGKRGGKSFGFTICPCPWLVIKSFGELPVFPPNPMMTILITDKTLIAFIYSISLIAFPQLARRRCLRQNLRCSKGDRVLKNAGEIPGFYFQAMWVTEPLPRALSGQRQEYVGCVLILSYLPFPQHWAVRGLLQWDHNPHGQPRWTRGQAQCALVVELISRPCFGSEQHVSCPDCLPPYFRKVISFRLLLQSSGTARQETTTSLCNMKPVLHDFNCLHRKSKKQKTEKPKESLKLLLWFVTSKMLKLEMRKKWLGSNLYKVIRFQCTMGTTLLWGRFFAQNY